MMGQEDLPQGKLFYYQISLEQRIRKNHPLRRLKELIDFEFVYKEVREKYGIQGNVSVPPPVILKLMVLLVFYNVRSERELMETVPERLDWLWFLGYDFDSEIPNHSVLSKARCRWGEEVFRSFFERVVLQCVESGLVEGSKIFMDSSLIDADASNNSVVDTHSLKRHLKKSYKELENRLEDREAGEEKVQDRREVNRRYISTTDPDAAIVRRGKGKLRYQTHRAVDSGKEIITATEVTPGDVNEAQRMTSLMDRHQENTGIKAETVVADSKYGTIKNYLSCYDRGVKAHLPDLNKHLDSKGSRNGIFSDKAFTYERETDTYLCPSGKSLKRKTLHKERQSVDYSGSSKECISCELKPQCTRSKAGRTIKRHLRQDELDQMRALSKTPLSKQDIKTRQHLMERSFARAKQYGFDRARWRNLWRISIQEYLTAAIQNIQVLIIHGKNPIKSTAMEMAQVKSGNNLVYRSIQFTNHIARFTFLRKIDIRTYFLATT